MSTDPANSAGESPHPQPAPCDCVLVAYPGVYNGGTLMMSKLHRLQAGVEDGDVVSIDLPITGGKLVYQAKLGRAPQELVATLNQVLTPVLLMPVTLAATVTGDTTLCMSARTHNLEGYIRALPSMVKASVHVTLTPSRDIWADDKYSVPEFTAAADVPDEDPSGTSAKDEEDKQ